YAAVGMASFIAAGYKAPLTAVVFVAETTGGHSYIIPSLIGAAVAYAISGEASVSGDQHLHETARFQILSTMYVREVMQRHVASVQASATLRIFADIATRHRHTVFPVYDHEQTIGMVEVAALGAVSPEKWSTVTVGDIAKRNVTRVTADLDLSEALRLLVREGGDQMLLVTSEDGVLEGIVTKTDILRAFGDGTHRAAPSPVSGHFT
ncbi:MAG TPA: CBS domain-containing protein, partial [Candidatus Binataceae bacterium]